MFLAITSAEDVPITRPEEVVRASDRTFLQDYYFRQLERAAEIIPRGKVSAEYHKPVKSDIPTLLISGFLEPATRRAARRRCAASQEQPARRCALWQPRVRRIVSVHGQYHGRVHPPRLRGRRRQLVCRAGSPAAFRVIGTQRTTNPADNCAMQRGSQWRYARPVLPARFLRSEAEPQRHHRSPLDA